MIKQAHPEKLHEVSTSDERAPQKEAPPQGQRRRLIKAALLGVPAVVTLTPRSAFAGSSTYTPSGTT